MKLEENHAVLTDSKRNQTTLSVSMTVMMTMMMINEFVMIGAYDDGDGDNDDHDNDIRSKDDAAVAAWVVRIKNIFI